MQADIIVSGDITVIRLTGQIDYHSADSFRARAIEHLSAKKVVFNLAQLDFVGSIGITPFLETIEDLVRVSPGKTKMCQVGVEFRRVFEASKAYGLEIYDTEENAVKSFIQAAMAVAAQQQAREQSSMVNKPQMAMSSQSGMATTQRQAVDNRQGSDEAEYPVVSGRAVSIDENAS